MTPNVNDFVSYKTRKQLDASVKRTLSSIEHENTLMAMSPIAILQRLVKAYKNLKPLLVFLTTFPLVPQSVKTGMGIMIQLLESLITVTPEIVAKFKAGRDLAA